VYGLAGNYGVTPLNPSSISSGISGTYNLNYNGDPIKV